MTDERTPDIRDFLQKAEFPNRNLDHGIAAALNIACDILVPQFTQDYNVSINYIENILKFDWIMANVNGQMGGTPYAQVGNLEPSFSATALMSLWLATLRVVMGDERQKGRESQ